MTLNPFGHPRKPGLNLAVCPKFKVDFSEGGEELLHTDGPEARLFGADIIGYLCGYAHLTNTRSLALLGDRDACLERGRWPPQPNSR